MIYFMLEEFTLDKWQIVGVTTNEELADKWEEELPFRRWITTVTDYFEGK